MTGPSAEGLWASGDGYEPFIGRWSRLVAKDFLAWLGVGTHARWLDVGCGTGALTATILATADPSSVLGIDPSADYVAHAASKTGDRRAGFAVGDAEALPVPDSAFDAAVSGLVLNFIPDPTRAMVEACRVVTEGGTVGAYVWDYAGEMQLIRVFWNAATRLDATVTRLDEGRRFQICQPNALRALYEGAGLRGVEVAAIDVPTHLAAFDDYWQPFLGGQGPAPAYAMSLLPEHRAALRESIRLSLPIKADGTIELVARAWAVKGSTPA